MFKHDSVILGGYVPIQYSMPWCLVVTLVDSVEYYQEISGLRRGLWNTPAGHMWSSTTLEIVHSMESSHYEQLESTLITPVCSQGQPELPL